jgi:type IV pilus assembly protein PilA
MGDVQHRIHHKGGNNMISKIRRSMEGSEGFTLIELMIVIAIIGILAAVAVPNFLTYRDRSRQSALMANGASVRAALANFAADDPNNLYPDTAADADIKATLKTNGTTLPATVTLTYTATGAIARTDYKAELVDGSGNKACATPSTVVKGACP